MLCYRGVYDSHQLSLSHRGVAHGCSVLPQTVQAGLVVLFSQQAAASIQTRSQRPPVKIERMKCKKLLHRSWVWIEMCKVCRWQTAQWFIV